eukprot:CAMPEP_0201551858 /NCGR_PEP_ID=MMETSP0173_2-20130828/11272_1 /ASSEMBLY_ACC=CAM_ASM_000268 /TAXON_ID=218659 /ORGANISM="Vexillifera sp., Strain DIVA3 564/2" /LENGTH=131 /DNA_ID=CAMNT_0047962207 /DNA_START=17 /DNA_END=412 /DNA_ORIENTATION=+
MSSDSVVIKMRLHSIEQGDVFTEFTVDDSVQTRKWVSNLVAHAKAKWAEAGKEGQIQSDPYLGTRFTKGTLPPALWSSANLSDGDIIPNGTKEFQYKVKIQGRISIPKTPSLLIKHYFGDSEPLLAVTFIP